MKKITKKAVLVLCTAVLFAIPMSGPAYANENAGASILKSYQQNFEIQKVMDCVGQIPKLEIPCLKIHNGNEYCSSKPETGKPEAGKPEIGKPEIDSGSATLQAYEQKVVELVNQERKKVGLGQVKVNQKLSGVAEKKAEDMRDNNYFAHNSPTYGSPFDMMKKFGVNYKSAGENIAKGQRNPESVMSGWMNSSGHKANILSSSFTEIGVGYVTDSKGDTYWVQMFITQ